MIDEQSDGKVVKNLPYSLPEPFRFRPRKARNERVVNWDAVVYQVLIQTPHSGYQVLVSCFHLPDPMGDFWVARGDVMPHVYLTHSAYPRKTMADLKGHAGFTRNDKVLAYWVNPKYEEAVLALSSKGEG